MTVLQEVAGSKEALAGEVRERRALADQVCLPPP